MNPGWIIAATAVITLISAIIAKYISIARDKHVNNLITNKLLIDIPLSEIYDSSEYYIKPRYSNVDPSDDDSEEQAAIILTGNLFDAVDTFLDMEGGKRYMIILADSGMGKTSFAHNYFLYRNSQRQKLDTCLIHLGNTNADIHAAKVVENSRYVILDAFDEDIKAIEDYNKRLHELIALFKGCDKIIFTARTQFFPSDDSVPRKTGIMRVGPLRLGESKEHKLYKLYICPFSPEQIRAYIEQRFSHSPVYLRRKMFETVESVPDIGMRPLILSYLHDIVDSDIKITTTNDIYNIIIKSWLSRESYWVPPEDLFRFSASLAVYMYFNQSSLGQLKIGQSELSKFTHSLKLNLKDWQVTGRSLLNRDSIGMLKFSHKSILEYLVAYSILNGSVKADNVILTDQIVQFVLHFGGKETASLCLYEITKGNTISLMNLSKGPSKESLQGLRELNLGIPETNILVNYVRDSLSQSAHRLEESISRATSISFESKEAEIYSRFLRFGKSEVLKMHNTLAMIDTDIVSVDQRYKSIETLSEISSSLNNILFRNPLVHYTANTAYLEYYISNEHPDAQIFELETLAIFLSINLKRPDEYPIKRRANIEDLICIYRSISRRHNRIIIPTEHGFDLFIPQTEVTQ